MVEQAELLEDHADAAAERRKALAVELGHVLAEEADRAAAGALGQEEKPEQRGLAGARWAGEKGKLPHIHAEVHILEDFRPVTITQAHILKPYHLIAPSAQPRFQHRAR